MKNKITVITFITIIIVFGLIGAKSLLRSGFYSSHDGEHQLVRQFVFEQGLKDGQIPVRFSRQLYNGYGYPLFMFTYRLPFYFGQVFRWVGLSFAGSIKAVFFLAYIASGLAMFWFARRWGNLAGLIAAILYMWAPYRFSVMFVRAALGEHVAAVFVPLLFGSVFPGRKGKINVVLGAAAAAALILSHAMMAQIVLLMFLVSLLVEVWSFAGCYRLLAWKDQILCRLKDLILLFVFGLGLAAYYLIPAATYRGLTQKLNPNYFADHFVTLKQLVYSPWGYTFSMKGVENDGMSFQVGAAQWAAVGMAVIGYLLLVIRAKGLTFVNAKVKPLKQGDGLFIFLLIFGASIFLMTEKSAFIWNFWKNYINIDMPWRFLLMATFSASALAAIVLKGATFASAKVAPFLITLILVGLAIYANRNHLRVNEYLDYPDSKLTRYRGTSNSDNEYRPKWDDAGITKDFTEEAKISTGTGQLAVIESKSNLLQISGNFDDEARVDLSILYFPGWKVMMDGQNWPFKYAGEGGIIRLDAPAGYHMIEARYGETGLMKLGNGITLVVLAGVLVKSLKLKVKSLGL